MDFFFNNYVKKTKFHMETIRTVLAAVRKDDWMVSVDLQDAYLHVPIHPKSRKFLRFVWNQKVLQFRALCFGLTTAPQVFTRIMAPISAYLHKQGIRLLQYLDDWLLLASTQQEALEVTRVLVQLCHQLGIRINLQKSSLVPAQKMIFLGVEIQTRLLKAFPSKTRVDQFLAILQVFLTSRFQTAKMWSSLLGHMASLIHLIPNAQLRMRGLQFRLRSQWSRHTQDDLVLISWTVDNLRDLKWWKQESNLLVGRNLQDITTDLLLYTDASSQGWGASLLHHTAGGLWSMEESTLHINILELRAVGLALHHFQHLLINKTVGVCSDNTTALAYLSHQGGTHSIPLNGEAQRILRWAEEKSIFIQTQFISGIRNVVADSLSRRNQVLSTEWTLHSDVCHSLWKIWGSPMIDPFATSQNFRLPNFVSPFPDPLAIATDAFLFSWDHKDLYAFPPFPMIRKVLNKLCQAQGTSLILIAPFWPRKEWFPDLIQVTVDAPRLLPTRRDLLRQPHFHRFHNGLHTLQLTAWKLSSDSCVIKDIPEEWRDSWRRLEGVLPM